MSKAIDITDLNDSEVEEMTGYTAGQIEDMMWADDKHKRIDKQQRPDNIRIQPDDPYYRMSWRGYISPARYAMAKHLNRCLGSEERVFMIDGNPFHIEVENMLLVSHKELTKLIRIGKVSRRIAWFTELSTHATLTARQVRILAKLQSDHAVLMGMLDAIKFNRTYCRCSQCSRSIDARQHEYRQ